MWGQNSTGRYYSNEQKRRFRDYYMAMPSKPSTTIRFFMHEDFYLAYDADAKLLVEMLPELGDLENDSILISMRVNKRSFEKIVKELLLVRLYRVEVYSQSNGSQKNDSWLLEYKGSPGNLQQFEEILYGKIDGDTATDTGAIMGVHIAKSNYLGLSCVNVLENTFTVTELVDNEYFTELEGLIAQFTPRECLIPAGNTPEVIRLNKMLSRNGVLATQVKKSDFSCEDAEQNLNSLLYFPEEQKRSASTLVEFNKKEGIASLQAVIKYLDLAGNDDNHNQFKLSVFKMERYVRLDNAAVKALHLLAGANSDKYDTVYGVLNCCATQQGKRLLETWIKQPIRDVSLLAERLDVVEALITDSEARGNLSTFALNKIPDLALLAKKLGAKKCNLQGCYKVYQAISYVPTLIDIFRKIKSKKLSTSIKALIIEPISELLADLEKYQAMIEETLDMDLVERGEFFIKPKFDEVLQDLYAQKNEIEEEISGLFKTAADDLNFEAGKTIKMESNDQLGRYFRVTLKEERALRSSNKYNIIDAVKGGIRFTTKRLDTLNSVYRSVNENYEATQKKVFLEILEVASGYADALRSLNASIALVDVLTAFAQASASAPIPYVRPKLLPQGSGILRLKEARHPCLERQDGISFIPNDVEFKQGERNLLIITGPNMGGKSTYMRTVGISVLLAHIGCFVPCDSAEISIVDSIMARVGADDCELKGLSTFMLEMVETCGIIRSATSDSLVIIDELGRGTSTYDGCGIAWSIAQHLVQETKAFSLFATHYHEITQLSDLVKGVINVHVTAIVGEKNVTPLYQVKEGICDKSYGIHCARIVNFPEDVINFAIEYQKKLEYSEGMKNLQDLDIEQKKEQLEKGDELISNAIENWKRNASTDMSDEELMSFVKKLKTEVESGGNLFIQGLHSEI